MVPLVANSRIVIDLGNTIKKVALFDEHSMLKLSVFRSQDFRRITQYLNSLNAGCHCIISSVIDYPIEFESLLKSRFKTLFLAPLTPVPVINKYATPATLGKDRIAAAVAGWDRFKGSDILVIDAGTAMTIDFVNSKGEFIGGSISPGLEMRFRALHNFTNHLPLLKAENIHFLTGVTTRESIQSGVINGIAAEIDGMIDKYKCDYPDLITVFGGGNAKFLIKRLKNSIFALPNPVLTGLNIILQYNIENTE